MNFYGFILALLYVPYEQEPTKEVEFNAEVELPEVFDETILESEQKAREGWQQVMDHSVDVDPQEMDEEGQK